MNKAADTQQTALHLTELEQKYARLQQAYDELFSRYESMQEKLAQEPAKDYRDLFNLSPTPMWIYDHATTAFLDVNEAAIKHYGYDRAEFLSMRVADIRPADEKERLQLHGRKLGEDARIYQGHWRHQKKNGEIIHVEIVAQMVSYGSHKAVLVLSNDVTEKIRVESKLIRSNRQLQAAQQIAELGYWELNLSTFEISLSEQALNILKLDPAIRRISYEKFFNMVHPDDRHYFLSRQEEVIQGERSVNMEHRVILPNGEVKTLLEKGNLVLDESGGAMIFEGIVQDITDRKRIEQEIAESERRMKNAQYVGSVGDWEYDCKTGKLSWSDELFRLFAIDPGKEAPSLEEFVLFYPEKEAAVLREKIKRALAQGENFETDLRLSLPSAPEAYHYSAGQVLKDRQGKVIRLYGIVQDITARKLAEVRLNNEHTQLRTLIDTLPDAIYIKDRQGRKLITNKVDMEVVGLTEEEVRGKTDIELFGEAGRTMYLDDIRVITTGKPIYNQEEHFKDSNDASIWLLTSKVPLYDADGAVTGLLGIGRVITERKHAEQELEASNERFHYVTRATSDAIWDWDILNDHLYWGEGYEKIFGYRITDTVANHIHSFDNIHPEDKKRVFDDINQLLRGTEINWEHEYRYRRADGKYVYVYDKGIVIRDENGRATRMIGAMQDISERKRNEEAIRKTQEKFTSLVNTIDGIVWEADAETFQFTYVSRHAEELLGYPLQQWIDVPGFWADHIHPDDREQAVNYCIQQTRERKEHQFEYRMIAADGKVVWLADFVTIVVEDNGSAQLRGVMVDITESKKVEEDLAAERKLLRLLIDNLPDYIYVKDEQLRHIINNKANVELLGFSNEEDTVNKTIVELLGEETAASFLEDDRRVMTTSQPIIEREEPIRNKDGELRWLLTTKIPFNDEHRMTRGIVGISRDITERKKIDEELKEKNEQLKKLSAYLQSVREEERKILAREVHDELGQLASVVKMDIDWLALRLPGLEPAPMKRVQHAASTTELLINTIRKIAATLRPSMLDELGLNASLAWQCKQFTSLNGITCVFEQVFDDAQLTAKVKNELFRICQESLTNVMRHAAASFVRVSLTDTIEGVRLVITDNGRGFDTDGKPGTLGLIGMRERALSVGGTISLESSPGKGTNICVIIPKQPI